MKCNICKKDIVLSPSAAERAAKDKFSGHNAAYYTGLFTPHADCFIAKREAETLALIRGL